MKYILTVSVINKYSMEDKLQIDFQEISRSSINQYKTEDIDLLYKTDKYLFICTKSMFLEDCPCEIKNIDKKVLLVALAENKSGFKDRIWEIQGENYEAISVQCVISYACAFYIEQKFLTPQTLHIRKGSFDVLGNSDEEARKNIFNATEQILIQKFNEIEVYKLETLEGNVLMISFSPKVKYWVLCVNGQVLGLTEYSFEIVFGNKNKHSDSLINKFTSIIRNISNLDLFKQELEGFTIIAEYLLNDLRFIALTNNQSLSQCIYPPLAYKFFAKYKLNAEFPQKIGKFPDLSSFYFHLNREYCSESEKNYDKGTAGLVLFFVEVMKPKTHEDGMCETNLITDDVVQRSNNVIKVCKLLRSDYLVEKKIKKIVKDQLKTKTSNFSLDQTSLIHEIYDELNPPRTLNYYLTLASEFSEKYLKKLESKNLFIDSPNFITYKTEYKPQTIPIIALVSYYFKDIHEISKLINYKISKLIRTTKFEPNTLYLSDDIEESLFLNKQALVLAIDWNEINENKSITQIKSQKKSEIPSSLMRYCKKTGEEAIPKIKETFYKTRSKLSILESLLPDYLINVNDLQIPDIIKIILSKIYTIPMTSLGWIYSITSETRTGSEVHNKPQEETLNFLDSSDLKLAPSTNLCYLIIPIGIPGMGKTRLSSVLETISNNNGYDFCIVSSDEIRRKSMQEYKKKNLQADNEKVFKSTAKSSQKSYYSQLFDKILAMKQNTIIFCDKNHPPTGIESLLKHLSSVNYPRSNIKLIGIAPKCRDFIEIPNKKFEFSLDFLITCMIRVINREGHPVLNGSKSKQIGVILAMFNLFKNYEIESCLNNGIDFLVRVPFAEETGNVGGSQLRNFLLDKLRFLRLDAEFRSNETEDLVDQLLEVSLSKFSNDKIIENEFKLLLNGENALSSKNLAESSGTLPLNRIEEPQPGLNSQDFNPQSFVETKTESDLSPDAPIFEPEWLKSNKKPVNNPSELIICEKFQVIKTYDADQKIRKQNFPLYLGIDVQNSLQDIILNIILTGLNQIYSYYHQSAILQDIEEISKLGSFDDKDCKSLWRFPKSLHVTTFYLGGDREKSQSYYYESFKENQEHQIEITHLVYTPKSVICVCIKVDNSNLIYIENKIPHITLAVCNKTPKYSNTIVSKADFRYDLSVNNFKDHNKKQKVYCCKLSKIISCLGVTKYYY